MACPTSPIDLNYARTTNPKPAGFLITCMVTGASSFPSCVGHHHHQHDSSTQRIATNFGCDICRRVEGVLICPLSDPSCVRLLFIDMVDTAYVSRSPGLLYGSLSTHALPCNNNNNNNVMCVCVFTLRRKKTRHSASFPSLSSRPYPKSKSSIIIAVAARSRARTLVQPIWRVDTISPCQHIICVYGCVCVCVGSRFMRAYVHTRDPRTPARN